MTYLRFSMFFPKGHPRAGQATNFIDKIRSGEKIHTVRNSKYWTSDKVGIKLGQIVITPTYWSGTPYRSKSEVAELSEPLTVKKVLPFEKEGTKIKVSNRVINSKTLKAIAENDGLTVNDFLAFFPKDYEGVIICWKDVDYVKTLQSDAHAIHASQLDLLHIA